MRASFVSGGLILSVFTLGGPTAATGQPAALRPAHFFEVEDLGKDIAVGGDVFWGIHSGPGVSNVDIGRLRLTIPPGDQPSLCVYVKTQDGRYWGEAFYELSQVSRTGERRVDFPTRYAGDLRAYAVRDVGVRAYVTVDCETSRDNERVYVPVQLGETGTPGRYLLLVNAQSPAADISLFHRESGRWFDCRRDDESMSHAVFDTECVMDIVPRRQTATLVLVRRLFNDQTETELRIYFP